jgi:hypothetical protein
MADEPTGGLIVTLSDSSSGEPLNTASVDRRRRELLDSLLEDRIEEDAAWREFFQRYEKRPAAEVM